VLLLDEPAAGLDPEARHALAALFTRLRGDGVTLLVSSHILAELDEYSTHMLVLSRGRVVENRPLASGQSGRRRIRIELAAAVTDFAWRLASLDGVRLVQSDTRWAVVEIAGDAARHADLLARLVAARLPVSAFADLQASYLRTLQQHPPGAPS